jgi:uncharacterized membrane protein
MEHSPRTEPRGSGGTRSAGRIFLALILLAALGLRLPLLVKAPRHESETPAASMVGTDLYPELFESQSFLDLPRWVRRVISLYYDLGFVFQVALKTGATDTEAPLYYLLIYPWNTIFGTSIPSIRIPSLVLDLGTIALTFLLGRRFGGMRTGFLAAGLLALSPYEIAVADRATPHSLLFFLGVLSVLSLAEALRTDRLVLWFLYFLSATLALFTHPAALLLFLSQAGVLLSIRGRKKAIRNFLIAYSSAAQVYALWLPVFIYQVSKRRDLFALGQFDPSSLAALPFPFSLPVPAGNPARALLSALQASIALSPVILFLLARKENSAGTLLPVVFAAIVGGAAAEVLCPAAGPGTASFLLPLLTVAIAAGTWSIPWRYARYACLAGLITLHIGVLIALACCAQPAFP